MKLLIVTHGRAASGLKSSVEIITKMQDQIQTIDAFLDTSDFTIEIMQFLEQLGNETGVIFTDLYGGSVNQHVVRLVGARKHVFVITGVNLPIVLSILLDTSPITKQSIMEKLKESQVMLVTTKHEDSMSDEAFFE